MRNPWLIVVALIAVGFLLLLIPEIALGAIAVIAAAALGVIRLII